MEGIFAAERNKLLSDIETLQELSDTKELRYQELVAQLQGQQDR